MRLWNDLMAWIHAIFLGHSQCYGEERFDKERGMYEWWTIECECGKVWRL